MQLLLKSLSALFYVLLVFVSFSHSPKAFAIEESEPLHFSGDKQIWDRRNNRVELEGHALVSQLYEKLTANHAVLDLNTRTVDATGDCVYISQDVVIYAEEMHFNLDTHSGTIVGGRVSHERFTLSGERINKLGEGRFQTHWGEYSTCRDCPKSWAFQARDVDLELEGYAYITDLTAKIKDAPAFWAPYMILPLKTKRQSGLLFPRIQIDGTFGFIFVQPYFWAIGRSADMTIGLGTYTEKGRRVEWEGRYALGPRSGGKANFFHTHDASFSDRPNRWSFALEQTHEFSSQFSEKLRIAEVSDNIYPLTYLGDSNRGSDLVIRSDLVFNYGSSDVSAYALGTRYRNVFPTNPPADPGGIDVSQQKLDFDPKTVQVLPRAVFTTNDKRLLGSSVFGGLTVGLSNFTRTGDAFDHNFDNLVLPYIPGTDPIRKATRFSVSPTIYTSFRPYDIFSIVPSARYQSYFYSFHNQDGVPNLYRGYMQAQVEINAQLERVYDFPDDPVTPRAKHLIRPSLTYSRIPYVREDQEHPFMRQISSAKANKISGYYFDNYDVVPVRGDPFSNNYFVPLGHSISYGLTTQWIRKRGKPGVLDPTYQTAFEMAAGQSIDLLEFRDKAPDDPLNPRYPFSRFYSTMNLNFDQWSSGTTYYYNPYVLGSRHQLSTGISYIFERSTHQKFLTFDRSFSAGYGFDKRNCTSLAGCGSEGVTLGLNYSINDYLLPSLVASHNLVTHLWDTATFNLQYQNTSQCWRLNFKLDYNLANKATGGRPTNWMIDMSLNLTGMGFSGLGELTQQSPTAPAATR